MGELSVKPVTPMVIIVPTPILNQGKRLPEHMQPLQMREVVMLEKPLRVRNAIGITQGLVPLNVTYVTRWAIRQRIASTKDQPLG